MSRKILVVDDEADLREFIGMRLEANGYEVMTAIHGQDALEKLKSGLPDLIVTDVIMPVMDGVDLYRQLKKDPHTKNIPILVLTAKGDMEENFRKIEIDEFIAKPIDHEEFLSKVKGCLEQSTKKRPSHKVLIGGSVDNVTQDIESQMKERKHEVTIVSKVSDMLEKASAVNPDLILMDVLMENKPANEIIKSLRKSPAFKEIPIVIFSHMDKESLGSQSSHEKKLEIENAKTACLDAGATESVGSSDEDGFFSNIMRYLT